MGAAVTLGVVTDAQVALFPSLTRPVGVACALAHPRMHGSKEESRSVGRSDVVRTWREKVEEEEERGGRRVYMVGQRSDALRVPVI